MECPVCNKVIEKDIEMHIDECLENKKIETDDGYDKLTAIQKKGLIYVGKKAKLHEKETKHIVLVKLIDLGYGEEMYSRLREHIKNVFVTINIPTKVLATELKSTQLLKNAYELGKGEYRTTKENVIFGKIYADCSDSEKVKYGALNIFNEPYGMRSCHMYGKSVMVIKNRVKRRMSFVYKNSSVSHTYICTFDNCMQMFVHSDDGFLKAIIDHIEKKPTKIDFSYVEAQIHGEINIDRDIEEILIPNDEYLKYSDDLGMFQLNHPSVKIVKY